MVVAVGAMVLALLVALACFVWLGPQEKRAAAAATASRVASLFWLSGGAGLVSEGEHQRRQVHGYFWATDPDGRGSANASAAEGIAREFARSLSEHPGLLDALVVVHAVRTRAKPHLDRPQQRVDGDHFLARACELLCVPAPGLRPGVGTRMQ